MNLSEESNSKTKVNAFVEFIRLSTCNSGGYTFIEQMPNTDYLISLQHLYEKAASFEVYDSSQSMKSVFNFEEVHGGTYLDLLSC